MKLSKSILAILSVLVLIVVVGTAYLLLNAEYLAKSLSQRLGSQALGVAVHVGDVEIDWKNQAVNVTDIHIANPPGFEGRYVLMVGHVGIRMGDIGPSLLVFEDISIRDAHINLEMGPEGTNVQTLRHQIAAQKNRAIANGDIPTKEQEARAPEEDLPLKVIVKDLRFEDAQLNPQLLMLRGDSAAISMPDVHLEGIGARENGVLVRDALAQIWKQLSKQVDVTAIRSGFYRAPFKALKDGVKNELEEFKKLKSFKNNLKQDLDGVGDSIKGVFGN